MQHRTMDRWIELAEARNVGQWAVAEHNLAPAAAPEALPSLMTRVRAMIMLDVALLRRDFVSSTKSPA